MIRLKTGQNGAIECIQSNCDFMLLFGNESLTSLVDINIRRKLTWRQELDYLCTMLRHQTVSCMLQNTTEMQE